MARIAVRAILSFGLLFSAACLTAQNLEVQVVDLRDGGFWPSSIQRSAGSFLLVLKNRSMSKEFTVGISIKGGAAVVAPVRFSANNQDFLVNLPAGTYVVSDSEHPKWSPLTITVQ